jgi:hypothetical protein
MVEMSRTTRAGRAARAAQQKRNTNSNNRSSGLMAVAKLIMEARNR